MSAHEALSHQVAVTPNALRTMCVGYAQPSLAYCGKCLPCRAATELERIQAAITKMTERAAEERARAEANDDDYSCAGAMDQGSADALDWALKLLRSEG